MVGSMDDSHPLRVSILGQGRAGRAVAAECRDAEGVELVGTWNRTPREGSASGRTVPSELLEVDLVLLAVRDGAVESVARTLTPPPGAAVVHLSGSADTSLLPPLPCSRGCWHPLQAFTEAGTPPSAPPYAVAVEGDAVAVERGRLLATRLGHPSVELPAGARAAYHAAAVLASNCLVALEASAVRTLERAGVPRAEGWRLLWPLVAGTIGNLSEGPEPRSLTGPIARGDATTVERNLLALVGDEDARRTYQALGLESVRLAADMGVQEADLDAIRTALACVGASGDP